MKKLVKRLKAKDKKVRLYDGDGCIVNNNYVSGCGSCGSSSSGSGGNIIRFPG